jgi:hypothetical protein
MKKFITVWISCSLALAVTALAQQDDTQPTPRKKKRQENAQAAQQGSPAARPQAGRPAAAGGRQHPGRRAREAAAANENGMNGAAAKEPTTSPANARMQRAQRRKERKAANPAETGSTPAEATSTPAAPAGPNAKTKGQKTQTQPQTAAEQPQQTQQTQQTQTAASSVRKAQPNPNRKRMAQAKKPNVEKIKSTHASFHAEAKPQKVPAVTFNQNHQISGSQHWAGPKYEVFRTYHPQRHDEHWYHSHYSRIELIAGGYYYFDNGYWIPAWGYQPSNQYYVYDGPIYAGPRAEPPDRVIADVQAELQDMDYYKGEVDGLLGPLTREALAEYQADYGLYQTAAIDEPTLNSLGI